ncbi:uncharacterized protein LOC143916447 isoform X3 [Arctopsyche grandis]|uniref:uncharacterized protein LOC143916447 isoform X3 n=1 Tax=Arctopsyche grandis TaxID=121162 RepID=UPI00406D736B
MNFSRCMLVAVALVFATIQESSGLRCWQQNCKECPDDQINGPGTDVMCELRNLVAKTWLGGSQLPYNSSILVESLEFQCVKLIASDPRIVGDSTDVIRGCVLKSRAKQLCKDLKNIELEKRKTNSVCKICDKDMCNGAMRQGVTSIFLIFLRIFAKFLFH